MESLYIQKADGRIILRCEVCSDVATINNELELELSNFIINELDDIILVFCSKFCLYSFIK